MQISIFEFCVDLQFHCLIFEFRFDFLLINQTHAWLCTFTLTSVSGKLFYVAPSCYLKCPCHPMSVPQSCIFEIFFEILYLIETLAQFSQEPQPCFVLMGEACDFRKNHQEEDKSSLLIGEGKAGEAELGLALRALSTAEIVPFCARNLSKSQFCTMERFHHENGKQRLKTHRQE